MADDLGFGDVSILGNDSLPTPNIDRIGEGGITLSHHLTAASVCTPSRSAFLTGRYPIRTGMSSSGRNRVFMFVASSGGLPTNETTFARSLQALNYSTALFGKWHLGKDCSSRDDNCHHPTSHGFDYFFGLPLTNLKDFGGNGESVVLSYFPRFYLVIGSTTLVSIAIGFVLHFKLRWNCAALTFIVVSVLTACSMVLFQRNITTLNSVLYRNEQLIEQPIRLETFTERLMNETLTFIRRNQEEKKPFLAVVNFLKVHTAHFPSKRFKGKSVHGKYGDSVLDLDFSVGQILDELQRLEIQNETMIYFSSDNGGHLEEVGRDGEHEGGSNGRFRGGKGHGAMEGGIRVPSFAMWPGVFPANRTLNAPTSQMDIFATIHAIVSAQLPSVPIDGKDILPLLVGSHEQSPHEFLFHYCGTYLHGVRWIESADRVWKVYYYTPNYLPGIERCAFVCMCYGPHVVRHEPPLIFNIAQDPSEESPLHSNTTEFARVAEAALAATRRHEATLSFGPSQFSLSNSMWKPWLQPCCSFPLCQC